MYKNLKRILSMALVLGVMAFALPVFAESSTFGEFTAENLRGEEPITEAYFADAELTLVNYWATWCPPCREELPDLAKLNELSEGRVQVLGVLLDSVVDAKLTRDESAIEDAHVLLDASKATFPVVVPDMWLAQIGSVVTAVPTTFIVDGEGNLVTAVTGARDAEGWMKLAEEIIASAK